METKVAEKNKEIICLGAGTGSYRHSCTERIGEEGC